MQKYKDKIVGTAIIGTMFFLGFIISAWAANEVFGPRQLTLVPVNNPARTYVNRGSLVQTDGEILVEAGSVGTGRFEITTESGEVVAQSHEAPCPDVPLGFSSRDNECLAYQEMTLTEISVRRMIIKSSHPVELKLATAGPKIVEVQISSQEAYGGMVLFAGLLFGLCCLYCLWVLFRSIPS